MRFTVCETNSPPILQTIEQHYVPWYCNIDNSTEWRAYASGLSSFTLPLIAVIDPASPSTYVNRTTGVQSANAFFDRLRIAPPVTTAGDIDHSGTVDLKDLVLCLQIVDGEKTAVPVYADADADGDARLGMVEEIYILRSLLQ